MQRRIALILCLILFSGIPPVKAQTLYDIDGDGLSDKQEDKNENGLWDPDETDWKNADTDSGGEADGSEVKAGRDPMLQTDDMTWDQDGDGLTNGNEALINTNPQNADSDGDGVNDKDDPFPLEKAYKTDADHDGIADEWEVAHHLDPQTSHDSSVDSDNDGLSNKEEFEKGTDPTVADTDRDGIDDGAEVVQGTNPEESACLHFGVQSFTFADVQGHWAEEAVRILSRTEVLPTLDLIVKGYEQSDGPPLFLPNRHISRYEILKIALLSSCIKLETDLTLSPLNFPDVPKEGRPREHPDREFERRVIYTAATLGIVKGYNDGMFRPDQPVTRGEALKMLLLAARLGDPPELIPLTFSDVNDSTWSRPFIEQAFSYDLIEGYEDGTFRPEHPITRAEAAKVVYYIMISNPNVNGYVIDEDSSSSSNEG